MLNDSVEKKESSKKITRINLSNSNYKIKMNL